MTILDESAVAAYLSEQHDLVLTYNQVWGDTARTDPVTPIRQCLWRHATDRVKAAATVATADRVIADLIAAERETVERTERQIRPTEPKETS